MMLKKKPGRPGSDSSCSVNYVTWGQLLRETLEKRDDVVELGGVVAPVLPMSNPVTWDNLFSISSLLSSGLKVYLNHQLDVQIR